MSATVFISYGYDNDRHFKNLLVAWSRNAMFDLEFYDASVDVSVDSTAAGPIRGVISQGIARSDVLLCIVGARAYTSEWVAWEIKKAHELNTRLVGVKVKRSYTSPPDLLGKGAVWAQAFTFDSIRAAINTAYYGW